MASFVKVMVVDDEVPIREQLRLFPWERLQCTLVGEARHGREALQVYEEHMPQIVLTDIAMPVMDGLELTKQLKVLSNEVQVILLTCHRNFDYAREALLYGVTDYLLKGTYREEDLIRALEQSKAKLKWEPAPEHRFEIRQTIQHIQAHMKTSLSLSEAAERAGLSANYFGTMFHQETGEYFKDYVKRIRMDKAAALLTGSAMKVYEVAEEVGYINYRHFAEVFAKYYGVSPRDYRGQHENRP
jgi:YesN/AraC family two-component response regulator